MENTKCTCGGPEYYYENCIDCHQNTITDLKEDLLEARKLYAEAKGKIDKLGRKWDAKDILRKEG